MMPFWNATTASGLSTRIPFMSAEKAPDTNKKWFPPFSIHETGLQGVFDPYAIFIIHPVFNEGALSLIWLKTEWPEVAIFRQKMLQILATFPPIRKSFWAIFRQMA